MKALATQLLCGSLLEQHKTASAISLQIHSLTTLTIV